ncbi:MAG: hypothetical protein H0U10_05510 [Chloroflexia bacterium]|nr:hypothetical protein [Chloroflexia bacterium]
MGETKTMTATTLTPAAEAGPVACSLGERDLAERGEALRRGLFTAADERRELADGYAFRFPGTEETAAAVLAFVAAERRCCTFFRIELAIEPGLGPIWLALRGPAGTKAFVRAAFDREGADAPPDAGGAVGW